jgi:beta-N-acetylhexosaminidase
MSASTKTIRHAAGSLLVVGLDGPELSSLERAWLKLIQPSGIILFRRNITDAKQTRALLSNATAYCSIAHLRCVDIEGGTVDRLRDAVAPMPSAQAVAKTRSSLFMQRHGELIGKEASAFGFNTTLAPVMDLALSISASVMGTRVADQTPEGVIRYVKEFLRGLAKHHVIGCGKHFPGLGGGNLDSHLETPSIDRAWADMWNSDLVPYRELASHLPMVMVNHASYPKTRGGDTPATASSFWVTTVLQQKIGYRGLIFSDDMEMGGILKYLPMEEAAISALRAGIHLLEICHSPELILRCYEGLIHESEKSISFRNLLMKRSVVSTQLRKGRFGQPASRSFNQAQLNTLKDKIFRFRDTVEANQTV